jgi:hypothetical protein
MQKRSPFSVPLILQFILFLIPINIFVIGDWLATGIQWALFRYQQSYLGNSFIIFTKDMYYIRQGFIFGRSAFAAGMNTAASSLLLLAFIVFLFIGFIESASLVKIGAIITITGGCFFLLSDLIQYGILFHGPAGFTIPLGVPAVLVTGWFIYQLEFPDTHGDQSGEEEISGSDETV